MSETTVAANLAKEVNRRRTFAIISHPDAGKTTLTEKLLLYSGATYETADIISTYVYRRGLLTADFSYGTAIDLFQTVISLILVTSTNWLGKKIGGAGLW